LASKDQFFAEKGTSGANPRSNAKALELWLARLRSEIDKRPLEWIKQMIKNAPNERITAAGLMDGIHSYEDGYVYYNSCCNGEEESEDETSPPMPGFESKVTGYIPSMPPPSMPRSDTQKGSDPGLCILNKEEPTLEPKFGENGERGRLFANEPNRGSLCAQAVF